MFYKLNSYIKLLAIVLILVFFDVIFNNSNIVGKAKDITVPIIRNYYNDRHIIYHRQLAAQLLQVEEDLVNKKNADALTRLRYVKSRLDIRYRYNSLPNSLLLRENDTNVNLLRKSSFNLYDEYESQEERNPIPIPIYSDLSLVVTILIDDCEDVFVESRKEKASRLIADIRDQWMAVKIVLATDYVNVKDIISLQRSKDVTIIGIACDNWKRAPLQPLLSYVTSPYILFLSSVDAVTEDLNITRLLSIPTVLKEVGIVGMAERGIDGAWDYTCSQVVFKNAHLSVIDGYEFSKEACFFCDITSTSFLAVTSLLRDVLPDSNLPNGPREIDWAIRLQRSDILTVTCPDVMIHTTNKIIDSVKSDPLPCNSNSERKSNENYTSLKNLYLKLAQKYEVNDISFPNRTHLRFSCSDINYNCNARSRTRKYILPPCCLKRKQDKLKYFISQTKNIVVAHRISTGSVLGAVKFKSSLPWDFDDDITFQSFNESSFKSLIESLNKAGLINFTVNDKSGMCAYFQIEKEGEFRLDYSPVNYKSYSPVDNIVNVPLDIPCLLFGYYPIKIRDYLKNSTTLENKILRDLRNKTQSSKENFQMTFNNFDGKNIPNIKAECFLLTTVRVGNIWVSAPFNPGLYSLDMYKDYLKHDAHWRFKRDYDVAWPQCFQPGHPMCLDIHPTDGSIPFL